MSGHADAQMDEADKDEQSAMAELAKAEKAGAPAAGAPNAPAAAAEPQPAAEPQAQPTEPEPVAVEPAPAEPVHEADELAQKKAKLEADIADLEKRKRDIAGELGGEISRRSQKVVTELSQQVAALQQEIAALKAGKPTTPAADGSAIDISDEDLMAGLSDKDKEDFKEVLQAAAKISRNALSRVVDSVKQNANKDIAEIRGQLDAQRAENESRQLDQFNQQVEAQVVGFAQVNGGSGREPDPKWVDFLDTPKPGTRVTWRQSIGQVAENPVAEAAEAFKAYGKANGLTVAAPKVVRSAAGQVQPGRSRTSPPVTTQQPTDPKAAAEKLLADFENGKITEKEFDEKSRVLHQQMGMAPPGQ